MFPCFCDKNKKIKIYYCSLYIHDCSKCEMPVVNMLLLWRSLWLVLYSRPLRWLSKVLIRHLPQELGFTFLFLSANLLPRTKIILFFKKLKKIKKCRDTVHSLSNIVQDLPLNWNNVQMWLFTGIVKYRYFGEFFLSQPEGRPWWLADIIQACVSCVW